MNGPSCGEQTRVTALSTTSARTRRWLLTLTAVATFPTLAAAQSTTQVVEYYTTDALGSVRAVTKRVNGTLQITRHDFMPFGEEVAPPPPPSDKRLFTGKERDSETGLDYFEARYLRASVGRFSTPDNAPVSQVATEPQTWNRYTYTGNNPLHRVDPDGHNWFQIGGDWKWYSGANVTADGKPCREGDPGCLHSDYRYLIEFVAAGRNEYGAATGTLTLYDQNKVIARSQGFSGGAEGTDAIPVGTYRINASQKNVVSWPDVVGDAVSGFMPAAFSGMQAVPARVLIPDGGSLNFQTEWGTLRAALNEPRPGMPKPYQGNYLHGKMRPGDWTHGCICERSERILNILWRDVSTFVPVWVRR